MGEVLFYLVKTWDTRAKWRCDFEMTDIREIQLVELEILKEVVALCARHNLRYTLYCGTLLGAIRHGGFIPWDNDVDIAMPLSDYRRFLEVADELPEKYVMQSSENTPSHQQLWAKVYADGTTFMPAIASSIDAHWGASIDIYPLIGEASTSFGRRMQPGLIKVASLLTCADFLGCQVKYGFEKDKKKRIAKKALSMIPAPLRRGVAALLLKAATRDSDKADHIGTIDAARFSAKYNRDDWDDMIVVEFEGLPFRAPAAYDKFLRLMYGDYMQLPPERERLSRCENEYEILDAHHDYREYQRALSE